MKRLVIYILLAALILSGCGWMEGDYVSVTPHRQQSGGSSGQTVVAKNYLELRTALEDMVSSGSDSSVISVADFRQDQLEENLEMAVRHIKTSYPIGAYAVEEVEYEIGTSGGVPAVAVQVSYIHSRAELQMIQQVSDMEQAHQLIGDALTTFETSLVLLIDHYETTDIHQLVADFAAANPRMVMETPEVTEQTYPNTGSKRVLELKFVYQTSRDNLRIMQEQVKRIFDSAALYVSSDARDNQKLAQLYAFLMERFTDYQVKTSITPAYSLLNHGVGDSKTFALVYAEMCRRADVECQVVVGTRDGEPWFWNMVQDDGYYYHVDLLACRDRGGYLAQTDDQMASYVWDYSAYPECTGAPPAEEETTVPTEIAGETTAGSTEEPTGNLE